MSCYSLEESAGCNLLTTSQPLQNKCLGGDGGGGQGSSSGGDGIVLWW